MANRLVAISGGFDPLHQGHLKLMSEALSLGEVLVIVDSDEYVSSKHRLLMPQEERMSIVSAVKGISKILPGVTRDGDTSPLLRIHRPDIYLVGPDHADITQLPEYECCKQLGIEIRVASWPREKEWRSSEIINGKYKNPIVMVNTLLTDEGGDLLLNVRGLEPNRGSLETFGGFLEVGETLEEGARRETFEEIGVECQDLEYFTSVKGRYSDGRDLISTYFTGKAIGSPKPTEESLGVKTFNGIPTSPFFNQCDYTAVSQFFSRKR